MIVEASLPLRILFASGYTDRELRWFKVTWRNLGRFDRYAEDYAGFRVVSPTQKAV